MMVSVRFSIFSFIFFHTWHDEAWFSEVCPTRHLLSFYNQKFTNCLCDSYFTFQKFYMLFKRVDLFYSFFNHFISLFHLFFEVRSSHIAGSVICRFSSLGWDGRCAVFWPVVFAGIAVGLDLLSLLPETKVFVVFDHFVRRQQLVFLFITLHVRHLTFCKNIIQ